MEETLQLLSFFCSFLFGFCFSIFTCFHFKVSEKYPTFLKYISTFLFILDVLLAYLLIMYYLNNGVIHIYFLVFVFLGFVSFHFLSKNVKYRHFIDAIIEKIRHK